MKLAVVWLAAAAVFGCKESKAPEAKGPEKSPPKTASASTPDKPGAEPAAPVAKPAPAKPPALPAKPAEAKPAAPAEAKPTRAPTAPSDTKPATPTAATMTVGGLKLVPPSGWVVQQPRSPMRMAQFQLPAVEGDPRAGVLTVIAAGGGLDANIARWEGQFQDKPKAKRTVDTVGSLEVTRVEIEGAFLFKARPMAPGPGTPQPGTLLLGAIVNAGQSQLFFKAWGPKKTMEKWRPAFDAMVKSFAPAG